MALIPEVRGAFHAPFEGRGIAATGIGCDNKQAWRGEWQR